VTNEPTEMELRVAKAIYERATVMPNGQLHLMKKKPWEKLQNISRVKYLNDARAAIRAMRAPTTEMLTCGYAAGYAADNGADEVTEVLAEIVYTAMIRAASPQEE